MLNTASLDPQNTSGLSHYCSIQWHKPVQSLAWTVVGQEGSGCSKITARHLTQAAVCSSACQGSRLLSEMWSKPSPWLPKMDLTDMH